MVHHSLLRYVYRKKILMLYFSIFCMTFFIDRWTKALAVGLNNDLSLSSWLTLQLSFNRGISWGLLFFQEPMAYFFVSSLTLIIGLSVAWYAYLQHKQNNTIVGQILVLSGACSNLIDRIFYPGVIDFILISYGDYQWPVFNIADVCIVVGVFYLMVTYKDE